MKILVHGLWKTWVLFEQKGIKLLNKQYQIHIKNKQHFVEYKMRDYAFCL